MHFNQTELYDKIYGCWIGKSIGGTLGTPFEGKQELLDIKGFHSKPGKPLPNDDLDLQLVWLHALETYGPLGVNERVLGEMWMNYIPPSWNEYGVGKSNMRAGIQPPLCGDFENVWKHSNGAWIRSEIWACSAPGRPDIAKKYAYYDACVDHGTAEGTYAELFTATVESAAFVESDPKTLIQIGLSYLPEDCRTARSIRIAVEAHENGLGWQEARQKVLDDSLDLGWFQAPANVAFTVIGWLYGEGDFKNSLLIAVNCGDDTDCTGATLGSIIGIIGGFHSIPKDWVEYVGDEIISVAIDRGSLSGIPPTCTDLAERTIRSARQMLGAYHTGVTIGVGPDDFAGMTGEALFCRETPEKEALDGAIVHDFIHTTARVTYPAGIMAKPGVSLPIHIVLQNNTPHQQHGDMTCFFPEHLTGETLPKHVNLQTGTLYTEPVTCIDLSVSVSAEAPATVRGVIQIIITGRPTPILIPILLFNAGQA